MGVQCYNTTVLTYQPDVLYGMFTGCIVLDLNESAASYNQLIADFKGPIYRSRFTNPLDGWKIEI
jgi:hypothetical protein